VFFGEQHELGERWIANALAFEDGPIAALSIKGDQGIGKKMFVQGLAETLIHPAVADHNDLVGTYQYGLLKSPFMNINEGFPRMGKDVTPYHTFRMLVSGDPIRANRRYLHPVEIQCPYRVIFTANNDNIVESLVGKSNLSPEDRGALAIRLIHMDLKDHASLWLRARGGYALTAVPGSRWVRGDSGDRSDFIVAKHFLYLHANCRGRRGPRLLVEGNCGADIMFKLRTQSGAAPLVIETIIRALSDARMMDGIAIDNDRLYVLPQSVVDIFRLKLAATTRESLTAQSVIEVLKGLSLRKFDNPITVESQKKLGRRRWIEIDASVLLSAAERLGSKCDKLEDLVARQKTLIGKEIDYGTSSGN